MQSTPAGDLLTLNHTIAGTGTVPAYTLGFTPAHQLNSEASSQASYTYQPATIATDSYGTPNSLNQYKTINGAPANGHDCQGNAQQYSYDCNGNLTGDGTWSYAYDPENRLITANKTSGGTVAATYAYDPLGRRTHKSGTGVTETYFVDDGTDEIAEYNSTGNPVTRYVPGPAINEPVASFTVSTSAHRYFQTDHHGSVIAMVSQGGNELEGPYTYDAYGNCFVGAAACGSSGAPYKFVGMRFDPETGLYYDRDRMYSGILGRFMQTDPVGYSADLGMYTYVGNDPTNKTDPTGQFTCVDNGNGTQTCTSDGSILDNAAVYAYSAYMHAMYGNTNSSNNGNGNNDNNGNSQPGVGHNGGPPMNNGNDNGNNNNNQNGPGLPPPVIPPPSSDNTHPSTPTGTQTSPADVKHGTNSPTNIGGRDYSGHSQDRMQGRAIPPSVVENAIQHGISQPGNRPGTTQHYDPANNITVVTDTATGRVVTVRYGQ